MSPSILPNETSQKQSSLPFLASSSLDACPSCAACSERSTLWV
jgi:hypothetical protein